MDLKVFALPDSLVTKPGAMTIIRTIGGVEPFMFRFFFGGFYSGWMAFTGCASDTRLLVVVDAGNGAVHVIDVVHGQHVGYVAAPGSIARPRGVAAWGTKDVAVCCDSETVRFYKGSRETWTVVRVIDIGSHFRHFVIGLRFTRDGTGLALVRRRAERSCVDVICVEDGSFVSTVSIDAVYPVDLEDCGEHGWAVSNWSSHRIQFIGGANGQICLDDGEFVHPTSLALVPGLGLMVRDYQDGGRLRLFATPDAIAMAAMSISKATWMMAVARSTRMI
jgi:hypothetical protein